MNKKPYILIFSIVVIICLVVPLVCTNIKTSHANTPRGFSVVIDAGHGGIDSGAIGVVTKNKESDLNLNISLSLGRMLEDLGIHVTYTRTTQDGLYGTTDSGYKRRDMLERKRIVVESDADLVISIHLNKFSSPSRRGAQVYYQKGDETSKTLADSIQNVLNTNINIPQQSRAYTSSWGDFWMCKIIKPAVIVECGFLSNEKDDLLFDSSEYREQIAYLIFDGIVSYLVKETSFSTIIQ